MTERQAFEAMRFFLESYVAREPPERRTSLEQLLHWTESDRMGATSDPAQWRDWEHAVSLVTRSAPS